LRWSAILDDLKQFLRRAQGYRAGNLEVSMANPFVHVELQTQDLSKAKKFYKSLFDWKLQDIPKMDYTMVDVGKGTGGGMMRGVERYYRSDRRRVGTVEAQGA
jgi:hypothetical protein